MFEYMRAKMLAELACMLKACPHVPAHAGKNARRARPHEESFPSSSAKTKNARRACSLTHSLTYRLTHLSGGSLTCTSWITHFNGSPLVICSSGIITCTSEITSLHVIQEAHFCSSWIITLVSFRRHITCTSWIIMSSGCQEGEGEGE